MVFRRLLCGFFLSACAGPGSAPYLSEADHKLMQPDSEGYLELAPGYLTTMGDWLAARR